MKNYLFVRMVEFAFYTDGMTCLKSLLLCIQSVLVLNYMRVHMQFF